ncbi:MAG TPA: M17 family peptidase N-terminal domain-containing protein, partial [Streptosporangiaceae bacterium]
MSGAGLRTAGDCLRAISAGSLDPGDLLAVPVEADGAIAADQTLDEFLAVRAGDVVKAAQHSGGPGHVAQAMAQAGTAAIKIIFLGVGDRSPRSLRRAGGELGRMLRPGAHALSSVVAGWPAGQVRAFAEGVLLGSYRYTEKSTVSDQAKDAELRLLVTPDGSDGSRATGAAGEAAEVIAETATVATAVALARD